MARVQPNNDVENAVLINCARRCALCVGLNDDHSVKYGQIAHIDRDSSYSAYDNLAYLCIPHHDDYDTVRRQSKTLKPDELRHYKRLVCQQYGPDYPAIQGLLTKHQYSILELMHQTNHLAVEVDLNSFEGYLRLQNDLVNLIHGTFDSRLRMLLANWCDSLSITLQIISDTYYIETERRRKFDNGSHSQAILSDKKMQIARSLEEMKVGYINVQNFMTY